jgi:hypothetical protein
LKADEKHKGHQEHKGGNMRFNLVRAIIIPLCLALPALAVGQEGGDALRHSLCKGSKALMFQMSGNSLIAFKFHPQPYRAWQLRLGLNGSLGRGKDEDWGERTTDQSSEDDSYSTGISLGLHYLLYHRQVFEFFPYVGIGPDVSWSQSHSKSASDRSGSSPYRYERESSTNRWSASATGRLGFEWFPTRRIGLSAEYRLQLSYAWYESRSEHYYHYLQTGDSYRNYSESRDWTINMTLSQIGIGIGLYF